MFTKENNLRMINNRLFIMNNMIREEIAHIKGYPEKLIIFLHGYIDSATSLERKIQPLLDGLDNCAIHLPQAPIICEIHENKRQWYSMHQFDPEDDRRRVESFAECETIYNKMSPGLNHAANYLNFYIDQCLSEYGLEDKDLVLCGFSQGAMMALHLALTRKKMGACISFSGILAGRGYLEKHHVSTPDTLLIHGNADNLVRFEALDFTRKQLEKMGANVEDKIIENGLHQITPEGLLAAAEFINRKLLHKNS